MTLLLLQDVLRDFLKGLSEFQTRDSFIHPFQSISSDDDDKLPAIVLLLCRVALSPAHVPRRAQCLLPGLLGKMYAAEFRMFRVSHWVDGGSEKLSHLLKVAELIGGRTGSVTRRVLAQGVGGVRTPLHTRARTHIRQRPEGELTA